MFISSALVYTFEKYVTRILMTEPVQFDYDIRKQLNNLYNCGKRLPVWIS